MNDEDWFDLSVGDLTSKIQVMNRESSTAPKSTSRIHKKEVLHVIALLLWAKTVLIHLRFIELNYWYESCLTILQLIKTASLLLNCFQLTSRAILVEHLCTFFSRAITASSFTQFVVISLEKIEPFIRVLPFHRSQTASDSLQKWFW